MLFRIVYKTVTSQSKKYEKRARRQRNVLVSKRLTAALVKKPVNVDLKLLLSTYHKARHVGYHSIKVKRLKEKQARYE